MPPISTILVTGANGQLGNEIRKLSSSYSQYNFKFVTREEFPLDDPEEISNYLKKNSFDFLINCAAYTAVDKAETERELAFQINSTAVAAMAAACRGNNIMFLHFSTDYVFDGTASTPYKPDALTNPQSVYGASKLEGERQAVKFNNESIIIRTSWVYSEFGKNFVKTMMKLMSEKEELKVVDDQVGQPTYAGDLAEAVLHIISSGKWRPGIYHYSNSGVISWFDFANAIKEMLNATCKVIPISTSQFPTPAKRPAYSVLNTDSFTDTFLIPMKPWNQSLQICIDKIKKSLQQTGNS